MAITNTSDNHMSLAGLDTEKLRKGIRSWQRFNGKSNRGFARAAEVDPAGFSRFMRGKTNAPTPETVKKYAKVIGRDPRDFYTDPA